MKKTILLVGLIVCLSSHAHVTEKTNAQHDASVYSGVIAPKPITQYKNNENIVFKILLEKRNYEAASFELAEITIPPGINVPGHTHNSDEYIYVLSGELEHKIGNKSVILKAGDIGIAPKHIKVSHRAISDTEVKTLVIWTPTGEAEYWQKILSTSMKK
ncbi:hypothetical protein tinsulaeT_32610 [Thalassotalea insulae]|uniref:Cupin type-2 domain-containing protein n=1 Tax=Thalassotalea insulae TaxID=2056778 RepID=A0ABQ6GZ85_9GAMM|nr:cupin domain-containing protein [Thalassotalea insulae]GLX79921.1 hypothetical protein tinsulaeT_32610 [Thalassotalea insulae]